MHLMVTSEFDGYRRGDIIRDATKIARIQADHREAFVLRIAELPDPAAPPAPASADHA